LFVLGQESCSRMDNRRNVFDSCYRWCSSGTLATTIAVGVLALEATGLYFEVKALIDYSQDGDEEALFKGVALGFLFLGAGKVVGKLVDKASESYKAKRLANSADEVAEVLDDVPYDELGKKAPCFLAGTLVKTNTGEKETEKLLVGDKVLSYNFEKQIIEEKIVLNLYNNWTDTYYEIRTNNSIVLATSKHLFWIENKKKWIPAKELIVGMNLKNTQNKFEDILEIVKSDNVNLPTYNFEVADHHNYFVGSFGLLVHNEGKPSLFQSTTKTPTEIYTVTDVSTNKVVYVGQTIQGKDVRIGQHAAEGGIKADWDNPSKYKTDVVGKGNWTPYEAHAWEQHHIESNGGKDNLLNKKNAITEAKYDKFGNEKYGHKPC